MVRMDVMYDTGTRGYNCQYFDRAPWNLHLDCAGGELYTATRGIGGTYDSGIRVVCYSAAPR